MATTGASGAPPVLPDFGPTLPALLRRHFGVRERATTAVAVGLAIAVAAGVLVASLLTGQKHLVYRAGPTFNLEYPSDVIHRVAPQGVELVRLEAHRGSLTASIAVTPFRLPPYPGNVTSGLLPVYEDGYEERLRATSSDFVERDEGSARVGDAPGYQLGFHTGPAGRFTWGRDVLLVSRDEDVRDGVVLGLRWTKPGALSKGDQHLLDEVRKAFKSFNFGTEQAD
jgi:hypothetical protein